MRQARALGGCLQLAWESGGQRAGLSGPPLDSQALPLTLPGLQVIVYVEDVNDEAPAFTQQQYSRLGLRETAGIGTSVIVVRATDRDTGEAGGGSQGAPCSEGPSQPAHEGPVILDVSAPLCRGSRAREGLRGQSWSLPARCPGLRGLQSGSCPSLGADRGEVTSLTRPDVSSQDPAVPC